MPKTLLTLVLFWLSFSTSFCQSQRVEDLKSVIALKSKLLDTVVLASIDDLYEEFSYRKDSIQADFYARLLVEEADKRGYPTYARRGVIRQIQTLSTLTGIDTSRNRSIDSLLQVANDDGDQITAARCHILLGNIKIERNPLDSTLYHFEKALNLTKDTDTPEETAALIGLAHASSNKVNFIDGIPLLERAVQKAAAIENDILSIKALSKLSGYYMYMSRYEAASPTLIEAINIAEEGQYYSYDLINNYNRLGDLYWIKNGNIEKARFYTKKAYELSKADWVSELVKARTAAYLAYYYIVSDSTNFEFAEELLDYSLQLGSEYDLKHTQSTAHFYLGMIYSKKDSFESAYPHFIKGINLSKEDGRNAYSLRIQAYLAEEIEKSGLQIPIFIDTTNTALNTLDQKIWFYRIKKDMALKNRDYKSANEYWEKLSDLESEQRDIACKISVEEQLLTYRLQEEEEKAAMQTTLLQTTTFKNRLLGIALALAALLLVFLYLLYRSKKKHHLEIVEKNERISSDFEKITVLNEDLNSKNKLLSEKNRIHRKEIVEYISIQNNRDNQLRNVRQEIMKEIERNPKSIADWQLVKKRIDALISKNSEWVYFKQKIESLYPDFFMNLLLRHPNLTEREQMHASYVLLGMSVNQVAKSLFISPKSAESARYRLKKKIGLEAKDNLSDNIQTFAEINNARPLIPPRKESVN